MRQSFALALVALFVVCTGSVAVAQDDTTSYIFGVYYSCDQSREAWSDTLTETFIAPIINEHVQQGHISGWGRMAHNVGGHWRRIQYFGSNDLNDLLDARNAIVESVQAEASGAGREISSICPDHDDYIWQSVASSRPLTEELSDRAQATYSTYFVCDIAKQARADEIVKEAYAPVLNQMVEQGKLQSWTWFSHVIGGKFRRLLTYSGADHKTLLAAQAEYGSTIRKNNADLASEFSAICGSHDDYLWDVVIPRP